MHRPVLDVSAGNNHNSFLVQTCELTSPCENAHFFFNGHIGDDIGCEFVRVLP